MRGLQRIMALTLLWVILYMAGVSLDGDLSWVLWCVPALVLVLEHLAHTAGLVRGFEAYHRMTPQQRREIIQHLDADIKPEDTTK